MNSDFRVGPWTVRPSLNTLSQNGTTARVEPKVMQVLVCLASQPGIALRKEEIFKAVWPDTFVSDDALVRSISELRRVFKDDARQASYIETIPKCGYRLVARVDWLNGTQTTALSESPEIVPPAYDLAHRPSPWLIPGVSIGGTVLLVGVLLLINAGRVRERLLGPKPPAIHSLAVLPLQSLSSDPKQEYFAEGITDALITDLAHINALKIVSRTTIMRYGHPDKPLSQIAHELNVDGIIEGTVQRSGERVRVTAQLIYGPTDEHLWANSFERDERDVFELQSTVANEIASQVKVKVTPDEQARFKNPRPVNPKALEAYVEARYHIDKCDHLAYYKGKRRLMRQEAAEAAAFLDEAIRQDPNYIPAYVAYFDITDYADIPILEYLPKARAAITKAIELDEKNVPAHLALARLLMQFDYNWDGAQKEFRRAIELDPHSAEAHYAYSEYLANIGGEELDSGYTTEAKRELELAQALDPAHDYYASAGQQRIGRTLDEERQALEQEASNDPFSLGVMGKDYAIVGRFKEAVEMYERCLFLFGWEDMSDLLSQANAAGGPKHALEQWMLVSERYQAEYGDMPVVPMAFTYSSLGDKDRAFAWLDRAVEQRNWMLIYLKCDSVWDPLRSDPRFERLLKRVGLPPQGR